MLKKKALGKNEGRVNFWRYFNSNLSKLQVGKRCNNTGNTKISSNFKNYIAQQGRQAGKH